MLKIVRGENSIHRFNLLQPDKITPLPISSLTLIQVDLFLGIDPLNVSSYAYPSADLRIGLTLSQVELEITKTVSTLLPPGIIRAKLTLEQPDPAFQTDGVQRDEIYIDILQVSP